MKAYNYASKPLQSSTRQRWTGYLEAGARMLQESCRPAAHSSWEEAHRGASPGVQARSPALHAPGESGQYSGSALRSACGSRGSAPRHHYCVRVHTCTHAEAHAHLSLKKHLPSLNFQPFFVGSFSGITLRPARTEHVTKTHNLQHEKPSRRVFPTLDFLLCSLIHP